ncbi:tRNA guanosine(15) transglycosylase TgtA [archaeon]|nr:MAG: tRNA guanosine(15) transglycosylase TgtA [archaeon]
MLCRNPALLIEFSQSKRLFLSAYETLTSAFLIFFLTSYWGFLQSFFQYCSLCSQLMKIKHIIFKLKFSQPRPPVGNMPRFSPAARLYCSSRVNVADDIQLVLRGRSQRERGNYQQCSKRENQKLFHNAIIAKLEYKDFCCVLNKQTQLTPMIDFELLDRDAGGRICKLAVEKNKIKTPNIAIVINPNRLTVPLSQLKKMGCEIIITNSYIINKSAELRERAIKDGLRKFLGWDGPVYTDSGAFQMYSQNVFDINPAEIVEFQKKIKSDFTTPLDVFTLPSDSKAEARKKLLETIKRTAAARKAVSGNLVGPIQGGLFLDLRAQACKKIAKINPDIFAIGGIVPLMQDYDFKNLCDIILTCKQNLPANRPVHAFGAGHPISFALLAACGCDLFDSAFYSLAAQRGAYVTATGSYQLSDLAEFPCSCPACLQNSPEQVKKMEQADKEKFLATHNLFATFAELSLVRQSIRENSLWELVQQRARAHPRILEALVFILKKYNNYFLENDVATKKSAFFYGGEESELRPEVMRAKEKLKHLKPDAAKQRQSAAGKKYVRKQSFRHAGNSVSVHFTKQPFGRIPVELKSVYPFGQSVTPFYEEKALPKIKPEQRVKAVLDYQFGKGAGSMIRGFEMEISKKTGRIKRIFIGKKLVGTFRASDGFFLPSVFGAGLLRKKIKKVFVRDRDVAEYLRKGSDLFSKFAWKSDRIYPGEEVAVCYGKEILLVGPALLNWKEMKEFKRGIAVKSRLTNENRKL